MGRKNKLDFMGGLGAAIGSIMGIMEGQRERIQGETTRIRKVLRLMWKPSASETFTCYESDPSEDSQELRIWSLNKSSSVITYSSQWWD